MSGSARAAVLCCRWLAALTGGSSGSDSWGFLHSTERDTALLKADKCSAGHAGQTFSWTCRTQDKPTAGHAGQTYPWTCRIKDKPSPGHAGHIGQTSWTCRTHRTNLLLDMQDKPTPGHAGQTYSWTGRTHRTNLVLDI